MGLTAVLVVGGVFAVVGVGVRVAVGVAVGVGVLCVFVLVLVLALVLVLILILVFHNNVLLVKKPICFLGLYIYVKSIGKF